MQATQDDARHYGEQGFVVARELFSPDETAAMVTHYMTMRAEGPRPGDFGGTTDQPDDPTHKYPRFINMHAWDVPSKDWATDSRILDYAAVLIDDEAVLQQTMLYFKPPGGRGQGLHQDQQYITIEPLVGMWMALEPSDEEVGCMTVAPGTHKLGLLNVQAADTAESFTDVQTVMPDSAEETPLLMDAGDVVFFHGKIVHGSYANRTADRWRRSFICHYVGAHAERFDADPGTHVSHVGHG